MDHAGRCQVLVPKPRHRALSVWGASAPLGFGCGDVGARLSVLEGPAPEPPLLTHAGPLLGVLRHIRAPSLSRLLASRVW